MTRYFCLFLTLDIDYDLNCQLESYIGLGY